MSARQSVGTRPAAPLLALALSALLFVTGCGRDSSEKSTAHSEVQDAESLQYLRDNYPSRDEMLRVRACAEAKTTYKYPPLPANYGPQLLKEPDPESVKAAKAAPKEVELAFTKCVFDLGLQNSFYPPAQQAQVRKGLDPRG